VSGREVGVQFNTPPIGSDGVVHRFFPVIVTGAQGEEDTVGFRKLAKPS